MERAVVALSCVAVAACGGSGSAKPDAAVDVDAVPIDAPSLRTVNGTLKAHLVSPAGVSDFGFDLSNTMFRALVGPNYMPIPAVGAADSTFRIDGVPEGTYLFNSGTLYSEQTASTLDLSGSLIGRADAVRAMTSTKIVFDVSSLAPWQATDELEMFSAYNGLAAYGMEADATAGAPAPGATSLTGFTYDVSHADDPALPDAAAGDLVTVTQLSTMTSGTRSYRTVSRTFTPDGLTLTPGDTKPAVGAFTTVDASKTLDVVWDRPAFAAEAAAHSPGNAPDNWSTLAVTAIPEGATRGLYDDAPDVVVFAPGYATDTSTVTAAWPYGDPYPTEWTRIAWVRFFKYRFMQLPGSNPTAVYTRLYAYYDLTALSATKPLEPLVGLVVNPQINGMPALGNGVLSGIGATPVVSWSPPTLGTASRYYVSAFQVGIGSSGSLTFKRVMSFDTANTQLQIPPGILVAGQKYMFMITARAAPNLDLATMLSAYSLPEGLSQLSTMIATP